MAVITIPKIIHSKKNGSTEYMLRSLKYVANCEKTVDKESGIEYRLLHSVNCDENEIKAYDEMLNVRKIYNSVVDDVEFSGRERLMYHYVQSFVPGETTPEQAYGLGIEFCERAFEGQYQIFMGTHIDRGHIHNHILLHNINVETMYKYHASGAELSRLRKISDEICKEHGLSTIDPEKSRERLYKSYDEWKDTKSNDPATGMPQIRADVLEALFSSSSLEDFEIIIKGQYHYEVKIMNEHIAVKPPGGAKFRRLDTLLSDENFKPEALQQMYETGTLHEYISLKQTENEKYYPSAYVPRTQTARPKYVSKYDPYHDLIHYTNMRVTRIVAYQVLPWELRMILRTRSKIRLYKYLLRTTSNTSHYGRYYASKQIDRYIQHYELLREYEDKLTGAANISEFEEMIQQNITDLIAERKRIYRQIGRCNENEPERLTILETKRDELSAKIKNSKDLIAKVKRIDKEVTAAVNLLPDNETTIEERMDI